MNICAIILEIAGAWLIVSVARMAITDIREALAAKRKR
jgi:hypothetical protein